MKQWNPIIGFYAELPLQSAYLLYYPNEPTLVTPQPGN